MATYNFSALTNNQSLSFNPATDFLNFDNAGLQAASGSFAQNGADLWITYAGKTVKLTGVALAQVSSTHFTFANGSKVLIGDNTTTATATDGAANSLIGTAQGDYLNGLGGNDTLDSGAGADKLIGGAGNDTFIVDNNGDQVVENAGEGTDTAQSSVGYTLPANVENLTLTGTLDINGTGNGLNNSITGNAGNNLLDGGAGADTLIGGDGGDDYVVDNAGDQVVETNPSSWPGDTVESYLADYILPANVEGLRLMGTGNSDGTGNSLDNTLYGNAGDNLLSGGEGNDFLVDNGGSDTLVGGTGNDIYWVTDAGTGVVEAAGAGTDTVESSISYTLGGNLENLTLDNTDSVGVGNALDNTLTVFDLGFQSLDGGTGTDTLALGGMGLNLDLAALGSRLAGFEAIDLDPYGINHPYGGNTLTLTAAALRNLSDTSDTLVVDGSASGIVQAGLGWTQGSDATLNGRAYHTYTQGSATLCVNTDILLVINQFSPVVPLTMLDGGNGFRLDGAAGYAVNGVGDVNGDGYADLIVGSSDGGSAGSAYVMFGQAGGFAPSFDLANLDGGNGFRLDGTGRAVGAAGDVNGDGYADIFVGSSGTGLGAVVFGQAGGFAPTLDLASLDGGNGFQLGGFTGSGLVQTSVSGSGDLNGDGLADLIVGVGDAQPNGVFTAGSSFVVFGQTGGFPATLDLTTLDGSNGFRLDGLAEWNAVGYTVSAAGDINGDGYGDLLIGASGVDNMGNTGVGFGYVVFGQASGFSATLDLSTLDGSNGFRLDGEYSLNFLSGARGAAAGDVNGDGFADIIVGAPYSDKSGNSWGGSSYVVFGKAGGFAATLDLSTLDGTDGFRLDGGNASDQAGGSVSQAGDINGDGYGDLIVGATGVANSAGTGYVVFGKAGGFAATLDLSTLDGHDGFRLQGDPLGWNAGWSVGAAGDVNGDGFADLVVGEPSLGSSYVVFGGPAFAGDVTYLGGSNADSLTGTNTAERFVAGQGDDTLVGGGGADVLYGAEGDDTIQIADLDFQKIDGGSGTDTLALTGSGLNLDLANFRNQISGIEQIDLGDSGNNTLTFTTRDMLNLSDTRNTLQVDGDAGDHYRFSDGGWVQGADVTLVGTTYHVFDNGVAHLLLDATLTAV
ncbi:beta strand repeat-containing protein [Methylomagnum ishizawai]|uniref:beta strand repeat-containing protein n=1 Tax=Methylomagnum ishizawai TaxID=1760988 RepID=UPI001C3427F8|nr:FG-GAP-like repeat-containing protein [Methylomagnum ishizawai]BBL74415.1 hypothetical protein MishRS11D_15130 [Methylomagnum ishizawai]